jgi:hypothetical protein
MDRQLKDTRRPAGAPWRKVLLGDRAFLQPSWGQQKNLIHEGYERTLVFFVPFVDPKPLACGRRPRQVLSVIHPWPSQEVTFRPRLRVGLRRLSAQFVSVSEIEIPEHFFNHPNVPVFFIE